MRAVAGQGNRCRIGTVEGNRKFPERGERPRARQCDDLASIRSIGVWRCGDVGAFRRPGDGFAQSNRLLTHVEGFASDRFLMRVEGLAPAIALSGKSRGGVDSRAASGASSTTNGSPTAR